MHFWVQIPRDCKVFPRRLTNEGRRIFNNRLLFEKNKLFSLLFSGNFCGAEGDKVPTWENHALKNCTFLPRDQGLSNFEI